jgi:hypothetical protein
VHIERITKREQPLSYACGQSATAGQPPSVIGDEDFESAIAEARDKYHNAGSCAHGIASWTPAPAVNGRKRDGLNVSYRPYGTGIPAGVGEVFTMDSRILVV